MAGAVRAQGNDDMNLDSAVDDQAGGRFAVAGEGRNLGVPDTPFMRVLIAAAQLLRDAGGDSAGCAGDMLARDFSRRWSQRQPQAGQRQCCR